MIRQGCAALQLQPQGGQGLWQGADVNMIRPCNEVLHCINHVRICVQDLTQNKVYPPV
jgi:hypothetical protein